MGKESALLSPVVVRKTKIAYDELSLPDLVGLFPEVVEQCRTRGDLKGIFEVCLLSRAAWATYLREFLKNGAVEYRDELVLEMDAGREAIAELIPELAGRDREDAERSLANVEQRLHFADTLHHYGRAALEAELDASLRGN